MNKREFLKTSSMLVAGSMVAPVFSCSPEEASSRTNWAANYTYKAGSFYEAKNVEEVVKYVKDLRKIKALGTRHCFNDIADTTGSQLSLKLLDDIQLDRATGTVTVGAGVTYGKLGVYLQEQGLALHNMASLPHISVVGACATATHGSGMGNGNLATAVVGVKLVNGKGEVVDLTTADPRFNGVVVGLGAMGIITHVTLRVQASFQVQQDVYMHMPLDQVRDHFEEIMSAGYSVSLFTDWRNKVVSQVWIKRIANEGAISSPEVFFGATRATKNMHPIEALSSENCTDQMGVPGPWHERLPHFKMDFTPSSGEELQAEYFVPRSRAVDAILAIEQLGDRIAPHLHISEIRSIDADDFWMSPCFHQPSIAIHFTWKKEPEAVMALLPVIEDTLAPLRGRPHWGKLFTYEPAELQSLYERLPDFNNLSKEFDPSGKFRNPYLDRFLPLS